MSAVWIIAVVAALIIAVGIFMYRRGSTGAGVTAQPPAVEPPSTRERLSEPAPVETQPPVVAEVEAPKPEALAEAEPVEAGPSEDELRAHLETRLQESERMLAELREVVGGSDVVAQQIGEGTLDVMGEGLEEVKTLAQRKKLSHAKDKGDALHAQLSLMLQSARRGQAP